MKTNWCSNHNKDVTIDVCVRCRLMCVDNPSLQPVWLWGSQFVERWGADEIERFLGDIDE